MIRGTVVGQVWATRKSRALAGEKLLLVATDEDRLVVGVDRLDRDRTTATCSATPR
jgi:microcompartment protein CcmK/EutM